MGPGAHSASIDSAMSPAYAALEVAKKSDTSAFIARFILMYPSGWSE